MSVDRFPCLLRHALHAMAARSRRLDAEFCDHQRVSARLVPAIKCDRIIEGCESSILQLQNLVYGTIPVVATGSNILSVGLANLLWVPFRKH
eukprot:scaffold6030_cov199-Amphora_coffeaeformis.AAC.6